MKYRKQGSIQIMFQFSLSSALFCTPQNELPRDDAPWAYVRLCVTGRMEINVSNS